MNLDSVKGKVFVPHTAGRYQIKKFRKAQCPLIERVVGGLNFEGRNSGKKLQSMRILRQAMELIELQTGQNPIQVIVDAISNCGPREDTMRLSSGGGGKRVAVDVSSFRRVNQGIYFICKFSRKRAMKQIKNVAEVLAEEFILASKADPTCQSIKKKEEIERNAKANR